MSALTNPTPTPVQPAGPRVAPVLIEPPRKNFPWTGLIIAAVIGVGAWVAYQNFLKPQAQPVGPLVTYRTAKVVVGPFQRTLRISGQTAARQYAHITAPRLRGFESSSQMELLRLIKNGSWVKRGDELAQIDPGTVVEHIDDIKATIVQSDLDVRKREAEQAVDLETLQQTLRVAAAQTDKARLDYSAAEVRTDVEREMLKLSLDEAEARYKQAELDVPQKKIVYGAELKILGFTRERHVRHKARHDGDVKAYTTYSPMEGLVVMQSVYRGGESYQVQQGDQLNPGQPLMRVVNPKSMLVDASANQAESGEIKIGQKATVGIDAFPGMKLPGKVFSIGALATGGGWRPNYYIRGVPLKLAIEGLDDRIIPDLSAYADIVVEEKDRATLIPIGAVKHEGGKTFVYVKQATGFARREISVGSANNLYAIALSGVNEGDEVRLD